MTDEAGMTNMTHEAGITTAYEAGIATASSGIAAIRSRYSAATKPVWPEPPKPFPEPINPLASALAAITCWFPRAGPEADSNATTKVLNVMVVFEFIVTISTFFDYKYNVIYSTNALQLLLALHWVEHSVTR